MRKKQSSNSPIIVVDTREQRPLRFRRLQSVRGTLKTGDYSIQGKEDQFTVERKTLSDLIGSLTHGRERFTRELERMESFRFRRLLIVASMKDLLTQNYRAKVHPNSILGSLYAFEVRYGLPYHWVESKDGAARLVERWVYYFDREEAK